MTLFAIIPINLKKILCKNNPNFKFCLEVFTKNEELDMEYKWLICKYKPELKICNKKQDYYSFIKGIINSQTFFSQNEKLNYYPITDEKKNELFVDQSAYEALKDEKNIEGSGDNSYIIINNKNSSTLLQPWDI
uniref:Protein kinase domain-containing protein n=1 Tax=Strongyloides stercoralis TaxID=6248 RepID=A0AAF5HXQ0_STRER